jgi:cold shock CspA family protein
MRTMGTVKWFDPGKGDGCVVSDGGVQAALPRATLGAAGLRTIAPGTKLTCEVKLCEAGLVVIAIYDIGGEPVPPAAPGDRPACVRGRGLGVVAGDVPVHRSVLEQFGDSAVLAEGATVEVDVVEKLRGLQRRRLHRLDDGGTRPRRPRDIIVQESSDPWLDAQCRWFSRPQGFGFVVLTGGIDEVFVHMGVLRRCNIRELRAAQNVQVRVSCVERGLMATAVRLVRSSSADDDCKPR